MTDARSLAFRTIQAVYQGAFTDVALDRSLRSTKLSGVDRRLVTELVYGVVRRQRTLDALIDQLGKKKAHQQSPDVRTLLHIALYQLRYLDRIPQSAVVHSTVELARQLGLGGLSGFVNGFLRQYLREAAQGDPLLLPDDPIERLGIKHSYPQWIVETWMRQLGPDETEKLCQWFNEPPAIDFRVNPLRATVESVEDKFAEAGVRVTRVPGLPQALRLVGGAGAIEALPGFGEGEWTIQDSSAQLVGHLLAPQPGETIVDACAAPGGKSTHAAELMEDRGTVWACDRTASRLRKLQANTRRLALQAIHIYEGDSRDIPSFEDAADRVLVDAPCSGLGTLHRHADLRWRQAETNIDQLATLQLQLLDEAASWVKPGGILVYSTCTLHEAENEGTTRRFLASHPDWRISAPPHDSPAAPFAGPEGWVKIWPHEHQMDGFFMVRFERTTKT